MPSVVSSASEAAGSGGRHRRPADRAGRRVRRDDGSVSAETAAVLPLLVVVAVGLCWLVGLAVVQMRVTDAARESARLVARGESVDVATSLARRVAPDGSSVSVTTEAGVVVVRVSAPVRGPAGVFSAWGGFDIDAEAVASAEPDR